MSPEPTTPTTPTKLCPTCGTRVSDSATRCLVCGTSLGAPAGTRAATKAVQGTRMPEITIGLPAALGLLALFVSIGAIAVFFSLKGSTPSAATGPTPTTTLTQTPTSAITATITPTATLEMTATPLPPKEYKIAAGDSCLSIAGAFNVSVNSIIQTNSPKINATCTNLVPGSTILVPQPTPTALPQATSTKSASEATQNACPTDNYVVKDNDTLSSIAANYAVTMAAIKAYNGMVSDDVFSGRTLVIPLCDRQLPNAPTPTPTLPPPYPAANLLLPADGAPFTLANETVTLQWATVGELRANEAYAVTIKDITDGTGRNLVEYVTDTKFIVPATFRPTDSQPHVMRWMVVSVRQAGTTKENLPIWEPAGAVSAWRDFTWSGVAPAAGSTPLSPTSTP
ncbi:MAG: LysM peptidoglycan-binding domain-containing protein [Anaerolineaceae bacterium]|nr:LysM peptidoglycan-binding domain-containing protein [Anaerolineaceae bacterium]